MQEVGDLELTETESEFNSNTRPQTALRSAQTGARFRVALRFFRGYSCIARGVRMCTAARQNSPPCARCVAVCGILWSPGFMEL